MTLTELGYVLGTKSPATSAMVDRLTNAGLVRRTRDPQNRRRVQLSVTTKARPIVGDTDPDTAHRLQAVLISMSPQTRCDVIDILIDSVRQSAN